MAHVCVADDDPGIREIVAEFLQDEGFETEAFDGGARLLGRVQAAAHALAAPINAPNAMTFVANCNNDRSYTVVALAGRSGQNSQMNVQTWEPGFVISGGSGHVNPTQFT